MFIGAVGATIVFRSNAPTFRTYLGLQVIADVSHVLIMYTVMGPKTFLDVGNWNFMTFTNIVASSSLCLLRIGTLAGYFGDLEGEAVKVD
jgi:hypothetical protein